MCRDLKRTLAARDVPALQLRLTRSSPAGQPPPAAVRGSGTDTAAPEAVAAGAASAQTPGPARGAGQDVAQPLEYLVDLSPVPVVRRPSRLVPLAPGMLRACCSRLPPCPRHGGARATLHFACMCASTSRRARPCL